MDKRFGGPIVRDVLSAIAPEAAEMVTAPCLRAVISPAELMVATEVFEVAHVILLADLEEPSEYCAVALYCCVKPAATVLFCGDTLIA